MDEPEYKKGEIIIIIKKKLKCSWRRKSKLRILFWYDFLGGRIFDCNQNIFTEK